LLYINAYNLHKYIKNVNNQNKLIAAAPTDGLWDDGRTDEDQIGATYEELEWAMTYTTTKQGRPFSDLTTRELDVLAIYEDRHRANKHKMVLLK